MGLNCRISYDSTGTATVYDNNGNVSNLYRGLLAITGSQKDALDLWTVASDSNWMNSGEDTSITDILSYVDGTAAIDKKLTNSEKIGVAEFMKRSGIYSLDDLHTELSRIFKKDGILDVDVRAAVDSGLFTQDEVKNINVGQLQDLMLKIEGQIASSDFMVEEDLPLDSYIDSNRTTVFGTNARLTQEEIDKDIVNATEDLSSKTSVLAGIKSLPYTEIADRFESDSKYADELMSRISKLKKIPVLTVDNGKLSSDNLTVYTTVKNTVLVNKKATVIDAEIEYLNSIPQDIWNDNTDTIKEILSEVESTLADLNLDVIGISDNYNNRDGVMQLLFASSILIREVSEPNIRKFAEAHNNLIKTPNTIVTRNINPKYKGYNIVFLSSGQSDATLFNNFGLIKVGDNLYHNVDSNASINDIREALYNKWYNGNLSIPSKFITVEDSRSLESKPAVLEGISRFLMSRTVDTNILDKELYSGYQVFFEHAPLKDKKNEVAGLQAIKTSESYLKSEFISDFYNYILQEKIKKSDVYNSILSKFSVTERDIVAVDTIASIEGIKYQQELEDYITLHKDSNLKHLVTKSNQDILEDALILNFPELKSEYEGPKTVVGKNLLVPTTVDMYLKVDGEIYRKALSNSDTDLFLKIESFNSNVYYKTNFNFSFDSKEAQSVLDNYEINTTRNVSNDNFQLTVAKSRINDNMEQSLKELSTLKDKSYKIIEGINSFKAIKDGVEVGKITYDIVDGAYVNPRATVNEGHRGKGIGTEMYLHLFDKALKSNRTVSEPRIEDKQSLNIFSRVDNALIESGQNVSLQAGTSTVTKTITTPQQITDAVLDKLKQTGLANNVYSMTSQEIEMKLNELGVSPTISKQVVVWHGTLDVKKDVINEVSHANKKYYGPLLSGTYFGPKSVAAWFAGWTDTDSRLIEVVLDEKGFERIDMKGTMPKGAKELIDIIGKDAYNVLLEKKKAGTIKGLILDNTKEPQHITNDSFTQYVAFTPDVIDQVREFSGIDAFNEVGLALGLITEEDVTSFQKTGVSLTPNGFVHNGDVYLNTDSANLLNTQIHEFGHLFNSWAKKNRPDIYKKGIELIQTEAAKPYVDFVKRNQPNLEGERLYEEALTQAIGDKGQRIVDENARNFFREWLTSLWEVIKESFGITSMTPEQIQNLTLDSFARAVSIDLMKGEVYKTNPYTIKPLLDEMLANKEGKMVSVQTINQILKQQNTKGIEKIIINEVLELEGFKGKSKIPFDDFKAEVNMRVIPLTVIKSTSFSDYGSGSTGVDVEASFTNLYNTDLDHQIVGHFSTDYSKVSISPTEMEVVGIPGTTQFAVIRKGVELNQENLHDNVFHATGDKESAEQWISNYNKSLPINNKGLFGHTRVWRSGEDVYVAEIQSDSYQKAKADDMLMSAYESNPERMTNAQKEIWSEIKKAEGIIKTAHGNYVDENTGEFLYDNVVETYDHINSIIGLIKRNEAERKTADEELAARIDSRNDELRIALSNLTKFVKGEKLTLPKPKQNGNYHVPFNEIQRTVDRTKIIYALYGKEIDGLNGLDSILKRGDVLSGAINVDNVISDLEESLKTGKAEEALVNEMFIIQEQLDNARSNEVYNSLSKSLEDIREEIRLVRLGARDLLKVLKTLGGGAVLSLSRPFTYSLAIMPPSMENKKWVGDKYVNVGNNFDTAQEAFDFWNNKIRPSVAPKPKEYEEYFNAKRDLSKLHTQLMEVASVKDKQFIAHRKNYTERLLREEIRRNAENGIKTLSIPTPRTLALIEGYIENESGLSYEVLESDRLSEDADLSPGDLIQYLGEEYIVVSSDQFEITIVEADAGKVLDGDIWFSDQVDAMTKDDLFNYDSRIKERGSNKFTEAEWKDFKQSNFLDLYEIQENHPDSYTNKVAIENEDGEMVYEIDRDLIEESIRDYHSNFYEDVEGNLNEIYAEVYKIDNGKFLISSIPFFTETLKQPDQYEAVNVSDFNIDSMSSTEQTILRKYEDLVDKFKKDRSDTTIITDSKGNEWIKTNLTEEDASNPIVAFQIVTNEENKENVENISSIFDSQLNLLDLYTSKEEVEITRDIDCG